MPPASISFDGVWKKFRRGERHDSLRDLVPALVRRLAGARRGEALETGEFWALEDVSFEVAPGEALGIIGPNGAGKSTTLKLLSRLLKPTHGRCEVRGRVGALIEVAAGFHPDLTGRENIQLQGAIMGMKRAEIARRFDEIVEFAGVREFIDTPVKRYSSGMHARLGFAIAAHLGADVLLIDEVLSVGDMAFQRKCMDRMLAIRRSGVAIAFVSHDLAAVRSICGRAVLLDKGKVAFQGPAAETIARYLGAAMQSVLPPGADGDLARAELLHVRSTPERSLLALHPADTLTARLRITCAFPSQRLVLGVYVFQQQTQVEAHNSNVSLAQLPVAGSNEPFEVDVTLRLNLARGLYALSFSVYDAPTQRHLFLLRPAAIFGIDDPTSYGGVAYLDVRVSSGEPALAPREAVG